VNLKTNPLAAKAIKLYHRRMREAHAAKLVHMEKDGIVQFVLAGYEVERKALLAQMGMEVRS
jgi:hypothetical protein